MGAAIRNDRKRRDRERAAFQSAEPSALLWVPSADAEVFERSGALELQRKLARHYSQQSAPDGLSPVARVAVIAIGAVTLWIMLLWGYFALTG